MASASILPASTSLVPWPHSREPQGNGPPSPLSGPTRSPATRLLQHRSPQPLLADQRPGRCPTASPYISQGEKPSLPVRDFATLRMKHKVLGSPALLQPSPDPCHASPTLAEPLRRFPQKRCAHPQPCEHAAPEPLCRAARSPPPLPGPGHAAFLQHLPHPWASSTAALSKPRRNTSPHVLQGQGLFLIYHPQCLAEGLPCG
ncbi:uncharacterized protein [Physeter macrocephalus]|uniref:Uncharacterized protein n=1 Tax=Physeter macrocephalus TaxID=9755 RepID=A0A455BQF9_PHYMC|nr:uncharacterized protein LOC102976774 [Physeter catodon]|eukprot:XP_028350957.1 wiskott-Aldrich syndrome protein homolog 1-like [Physeter catodon]